MYNCNPREYTQVAMLKYHYQSNATHTGSKFYDLIHLVFFCAFPSMDTGLKTSLLFSLISFKIVLNKQLDKIKNIKT